MLAKILLSFLFIMIGFFLWLSYENPLDVKFHFWGKSFETDLSTLMISSFVLGAMLVFIGTLARDTKRAIQNYLKSHQKKKEESLKEELNKGMDVFLRGDLAKVKTYFMEVLKRDPSQIDLYLRLSEIALQTGNDQDALHWLGRAELIDMRNIDILLRQAGVYQRMKRFDEAIRTLNRAIGLDETNIKALKSLRQIYLDSRRWEDAIRTQRSILKFTKGKQAEEETPFYLGLKYEHARDLLIRGGEKNLELAFFYAKLCLRLEMLDEALEEINEISLKVKHFPALHRLLTEIYLHKKDSSRAAQEFEKTFELSGTSYLSFFCTSCERESKEWIAYCPQCHQWSTYTIKEAEKTIPLPSSFSERVHPPL
jgi:tetratricopeptide (TPR) repeat protein